MKPSNRAFPLEVFRQLETLNEVGAEKHKGGRIIKYCRLQLRKELLGFNVSKTSNVGQADFKFMTILLQSMEC